MSGWTPGTAARLPGARTGAPPGPAAPGGPPSAGTVTPRG
ncbi:hypothetical protein SLNWT_2903 [Streptomyces albus]|uniref:Uncharacterized protein n=1 Tax=Streptomyces albus (strain ATCC 21838 / DSM 41398 / FERM P-419 / JCM 4703 / NBRC 107858) TaxID=1081613 RepID=A0A0B5ENV6_STRA4|nr:hypothetical protein SLNWT_2903 [Streptomyces albus]AOU77593.1 hypothetical protein SLNHY_2902 [Streptomyces albus]